MLIRLSSRRVAGRGAARTLAEVVAAELTRPDRVEEPGSVVLVAAGVGRLSLAGAETVELASLDLDAGREQMGSCVIHDLLAAADPAGALAWVYAGMPAGAPLAVTLPERHGVGRAKHRAELERARSLLFLAGFERPRLREATGGRVVSALRSAALPPPQRRKVLSVVVPVYNEAATFQETIGRLLAKEVPGVDLEIVVVESNARDGSRELVLALESHPRVRVILQEQARGKGNAVRAGFEHVSGDFVLIQDADAEYDVDDYDRLLEPLCRGDVGFVLGARVVGGSRWQIRRFGRGVLSFFLNLAHVVFRALFNTVYRQHLGDPFTMYKVVRRDALFGLRFECDRFDFDWELIGKLVRAGYDPIEIPVWYQARSFGDGKKITFFSDPPTWVRACFRYRFSPLYEDD